MADSLTDGGVPVRSAPSYMILIIPTSLAVHIRGINRIAAIAECEPDDVIADIVGPCRDQARKPPPVVREQRARRLLEVGRLPAIADMK